GAALPSFTHVNGVLTTARQTRARLPSDRRGRPEPVVSIAEHARGPANRDRPEDHLAPLLDARDCPLPKVQALVGWWRDLPRRQRHPVWSEVSKPDLKPWMGWILLYDVVDGGRDFRYRLVGSELANQAGMDLTGRCVSEAAYGLAPAIVLENLRRIHARAAPVWQSPPVHTHRGYSIARDRVWLPFS